MKIISVLLLVSFLYIGYSARSQWICGQDLIDSRDSKVYKTILIGSQCWMAENLNFGTRINSTKTGYEMSNNGIVEKYCWNDSIDYCDGTNGKMKKGGFYEWKEAVQYYGGQPNLPVQGVCPAGWHIPSNDEWNTMLNLLGGTKAYSKMLKDGSSGFEALLTGYRCTMTGGYRKSALNDNEFRGYYWSAEQTDAENTPFIEIAATQLISMSFSKSLGLSVRCINNQSTGIIEENYAPSNYIKSIIYSNSNLTIEFKKQMQGKLSYSIISIDGRVVFSSDCSNQSGNLIYKVIVPELAKGIYLLKISDQVSTYNKKFFSE